MIGKEKTKIVVNQVVYQNILPVDRFTTGLFSNFDKILKYEIIQKIKM